MTSIYATFGRRSCVVAALLLSGGALVQAQISTVSYANFSNPLFIPDTLSTWPLGQHSTIPLTIQEDSLVLFPGASSSNAPIPGVPFNAADLLPIKTLTYTNPNITNPGILGPTLIWWTGDSVTMRVQNDLMHESTTHWHGAHVAPYNDGGPHQIIQPMSTWEPKFKIRDDVSTMWYHPHLHMHTMQQVQQGMAGMIIVKDANDPNYNLLPHTYGVNDIPLVLQDKFVQYDAAKGRDTINWCCSLGTIPLVNGTWKPTLDVPNDGYVRLRMLNGASERGMMISLQRGTNPNNLVPFQVIASDAGYINSPYAMNSAAPSPMGNLQQSLVIMPGERYEIVFDARGFGSDSLFLMNRRDWFAGNEYMTSFAGGPSYDNPSCYSGYGPPNWGGSNTFPMLNDSGCAATVYWMIPSKNFDSIPMPLLAIHPQAIQGSPTPITSIPSTLANWTVPTQIDNVREKTLLLFNTDRNAPPFSIDGINFSETAVNDFPCLNATEKWEITNQSTVAHPFHMHDIHFFITDIVHRDTMGIETPIPVPPYMAGPKDVMPVSSDNSVPPNTVASMIYSFVTTFTDFGYDPATPNIYELGYMYHCHILDHEDGGMMHQFVVVTCAVGAEEERSTMPWKVYPNPSNGRLFVEGDYARPSQLSLIDANGRVLRQWALNGLRGGTEIQVQDLPAGMYSLRWDRAGGYDVKRITVQR